MTRIGWRWIDGAAVAAVAALCYAGTLSGGFVFDDLDIIVGNPLVTGHDAGLAEIFTSHYWQHATPHGDLYRPLTILSYRLNTELFGPDPASFHAVNVALHAFCSFLLLPIAAGLRFGRGAGLAGALIFAAHPIHTEAVAGVVGRADLMAAAGVLGALAIHLTSRMPQALRVTAASCALAAGLLSKESAVVLPALAIAADLCRTRLNDTTMRRHAPALTAFVAVVAVWLLARAMILPGAQPGTLSDSVFAGVSWPHRMLTALWVLSRYLQLLIAPVTLSADYSFAQTPLITSLFDTRVLTAALSCAVMGGLGVAWLARRAPIAPQRRQAAFCFLAFLAAVAPVSNLFVPIGTIMAERLLYLPSMAFCLVIPVLWSMAAQKTAPRAAAGAAARVRPLIAAALTTLAVLALGARTIDRNRDWKDQLTLFSATVVTSPRSARAHYNLGIALASDGKTDAALAEYRIAIAINPDDPKPMRNAALLLAGRGEAQAALELLEKAARLDPALPGLMSDLGVVYSTLGRPVEAEAALRDALIRDPGNVEAAYNLGSLLLERGYHDEAIPLLARATAVNPGDADAWLHLGLALLEASRPTDAIDALARAEQIAPDMPDVHVPLARAHLRAGDRERAAQSAARARAAGVALPEDLARLLP